MKGRYDGCDALKEWMRADINFRCNCNRTKYVIQQKLHGVTQYYVELHSRSAAEELVLSTHMPLVLLNHIPQVSKLNLKSYEEIMG
jgi:hypothetical protein